MKYREQALDMLRQASDAQLKKLYMKSKPGSEPPQVAAEEEMSDEDRLLLEQSLAMQE